MKLNSHAVVLKTMYKSAKISIIHNAQSPMNVLDCLSTLMIISLFPATYPSMSS